MKEYDYRLLDFAICKDINLLRSAQLFIWGAAEKGIQIKRTLEHADIIVTSFCDSDSQKWEGICDGLQVIGPDTLKKIYRNDPAIIIISCVKRDVELLEMMDSMQIKSIRFISYWGIKTACIVHYKSLSSYNSLCEFDVIWKYRLHNDFKNLTAEYFLNKIKNSTSETVWILQVGKTASSTLERRLKLSGVPYIKEHTLHYPMHVLNGGLRSEWKNIVRNQIKRKRKIVTAVREPLSRDYSAFWQAFSDGYENGYAMDIFDKDIQVMYRSYTDLLLGGYKYSTDVLKETHPFCWRDGFEWFNEEIKTFFGIDIYHAPFDHDKGYEIIENEKVSIFVFKVEMLDIVWDRLQVFLGKEIVRENANSADQKSYSLAYKEFRKKVRLPRRYVDHYYNNNAYMDHFYSPKEKQSFLDKWCENIED